MYRLLVVLLMASGLYAVEGAATAPSARIEPADNVPMYINYQGYLTDTMSMPLTGTYSMTFTIHTLENGGSQVYINNQNVVVTQGVFSVKLPLAAGDTAIFAGGQQRWLQLQVGTYVMLPRTEITSMAYGVHTLKADNSCLVDSRHSSELIWNTGVMQASSNFYISGVGRANMQLAAMGAGLPGGSAAVFGSAPSGKSTGVYGTSVGSNGVFGRSEEDSAFGVMGFNANAVGTGVVGGGGNGTMYYLTGGTGGAFTGAHIGDFAYARDTTGTAIATMGNHISDTVYTLAQGSGGSFNGTTVGVYGLARNLNGDRCGGFFRTYSSGTDTTFAYIAQKYGINEYRLYGEGACASNFLADDGRRMLFSVESPEMLVEEFGDGRLTDGRCRVELDKQLLDAIAVDADRPLRVFVTLNDNCNGVYVTPDATGFTVSELQFGRSNARFTYRVVATRRGGEGVRMPPAPGPLRDVGTPVSTRAAETPVR